LFEVQELDAKACHAVFAFPAPAENAAYFDETDVRHELHLSWAEHVVLSVVETETDDTASTLIEDLPGRSYALTEHGVVRHWRRPRSALHLAGERGAPLDLTGRVFALHGTDAACYDAYDGDPLYKHTPFLICASRPPADGSRMPSAHAIFHPTNAAGTWDVGRLRDDPWGYFRTYTQDYGGLEEWVLVGASVREVMRTFAEIAGRPRLVGRDWLGYLGETFYARKRFRLTSASQLLEWGWANPTTLLHRNSLRAGPSFAGSMTSHAPPCTYDHLLCICAHILHLTSWAYSFPPGTPSAQPTGTATYSR
jgi:hypothetical protein